MASLVLGRNRETGLLFLADDKGGRIDFDDADVPHIAVMLAEECKDDDERSFVSESWYPLGDYDAYDEAVR